MAGFTVIPTRDPQGLRITIPDDIARREGIREGVQVRITIEKVKPKALGLFKDVLHGQHFNRHEEGLYPDEERD